jgi:hypothetical protein
MSLLIAERQRRSAVALYSVNTFTHVPGVPLATHTNKVAAASMYISLIVCSPAVGWPTLPPGTSLNCAWAPSNSPP